jgi:hypothetical protein
MSLFTGNLGVNGGVKLFDLLDIAVDIDNVGGVNAGNGSGGCFLGILGGVRGICS